MSIQSINALLIYRHTSSGAAAAVRWYLDDVWKETRQWIEFLNSERELINQLSGVELS